MPSRRSARVALRALRPRRRDPAAPPTPRPRHHAFNSYVGARGRIRRLRRPVTTIASGPHPIVPWFLAWKVGQLLSLEFVPPAQATDARLALWFELVFDPAVRRTPADYFGELPALNAGSSDISKRRVMGIFEEVFGYGYELDPLTHTGPMVRKSDGNAAHDGAVIEGPLDPEDVDPGAVYQRLIDSRNESGDMVRDLRICVVGREIPYVIAKERPLERRFLTSHASSEPVTGELSAGEVDLVLAFCDRFGLDFGEVDAGRDRHDGRLYLLDANNTPVSPPLTQTMRGAMRSMHAAADAFERQFLGFTGR